MQKIEPIFVFEYEDDVERIVTICANAGYEVTRRDACEIWKNYSESMSAGWMSLKLADEHILNIILDYSQPAT